ncbi:MAG: alpha/beta hydrolase-fold protein [Anaerolineae bacterium]|nr:alpha/beta hydrolase-fold protein [Anaerolineae bacterium]
MHREYHKWYSPSLQREMELLIFGHAGARVLIFPTSKGRFYEWQDRGMMNTLREQLERGWLQCYCVDSVDAESWYNWGAHPGYRAWRHHQYFNYLTDEVLPLSRSKNGNPFMMTLGASFGAYHAMAFGLKYPHLVGRILAFSGFFDIRGFTEGYSDDYVYYNNPVQFIPGEHDGGRLAALRRLDIIMAAGRDDRLIGQSRTVSGVLWGKGIGNALREWDGWSHDWPYWQHMLQRYIGGHD